jgi:hypothetical protein
MFGDEAQLEAPGAAGPDDSAEISRLLATPDAEPQSQNIDVEALVRVCHVVVLVWNFLMIRIASQ